MLTEYRAITPLRVFLVLLFAILVVFQTLSLPGGIAYQTAQNPNDAPLRWPLTALAVFFVLCVEIVVVCMWKLLGLVKRDRIFDRGALVWVDAIVWTIAAAWLVLAAVWVFVGVNADDPGMPMVMTLLVLAVAAVGLLMV